MLLNFLTNIKFIIICGNKGYNDFVMMKTELEFVKIEFKDLHEHHPYQVTLNEKISKAKRNQMIQNPRNDTL